MLFNLLLLASGCLQVTAHEGDHEDQTPIAGPHKGLWYNSLPGDGGTQVRKISTSGKYHDANEPRPTPSSAA